MAQELKAGVIVTPHDERMCFNRGSDVIAVTERETEFYLKSEADAVIAELRDKCQMHDFFWEGCGFAKRGFKNTIAISNTFDDLEAENAKLKDQVRVTNGYANMAYALNSLYERDIKVQKYKRCLAMARWCASRSANWCFDPADDELHKSEFYEKWKLRWRELAEKFKEAK